MPFQILVADEDEASSTDLINRLSQIADFKVTHVKDALQAFRKTRMQRFDGIFLTDSLPKIGLPQLISAIRELDNHKKVPVFLLSLFPEMLTGEARKHEKLMIYHRESGQQEAVEWLKGWLLNGKRKEEENSLPTVKVDVRIVNQMVQATIYSLALFGGVSKVEPRPIEAFNQNCKYIDSIAVAGATAIMSTVFAGTIMIAFAEETFLKVMSSVLSDNFTSLTNELMDGCGELINIIYGQAKTILVDEMGMDFMKSRPYIIDDQERIRSYHSSTSFIVPFNSEAGPLFLIVSFDAIKSSAGLKVA